MVGLSSKLNLAIIISLLPAGVFSRKYIEGITGKNVSWMVDGKRFSNHELKDTNGFVWLCFAGVDIINTIAINSVYKDAFALQ